MKIGKSIHIDPGAIFGLFIAIAGSIPEIVRNEWVIAHTSEGLRHLIILAGIIITAMRGQAVRREQYRTEEAQPEVVIQKEIEDNA